MKQTIILMTIFILSNVAASDLNSEEIEKETNEMVNNISIVKSVSGQRVVKKFKEYLLDAHAEEVVRDDLENGADVLVTLDSYEDEIQKKEIYTDALFTAQYMYIKIKANNQTNYRDPHIASKLKVYSSLADGKTFYMDLIYDAKVVLKNKDVGEKNKE